MYRIRRLIRRRIGRRIILRITCRIRTKSMIVQAQAIRSTSYPQPHQRLRGASTWGWHIFTWRVPIVLLQDVLPLSSCKACSQSCPRFRPECILRPGSRWLNPSTCSSRCSFCCDWCRKCWNGKTSGRWSYSERTGGTTEGGRGGGGQV